MIESEAGGAALAQYWLLLLHLKKKDIPAAQVGHCLNTDVYVTVVGRWSLVILGDLGADSRGDRQIKRAKSVRAKVNKVGGRPPGNIPLTDQVKSPFAFLLLIEHTQGVNFSQHLNLIFVLVVFFFLEYPSQISRFLGFVSPTLLKLSSMVGLSNERDGKLIFARVRSGYKI